MPLQAEEIRIAAAANLRYVLPELAKQFEKQTDHQLAISYAASGTLTTQIQHGAPFEVFLSADPSYIQRLINAGFTQGEPVNYAQAQLALFSSHQSSLDIDEGMASLKKSLAQGQINKIAIANPRHAPYGQAAKVELDRLEIWQQVQPHLLIAENASQAVQFSLSPMVDAGLLPYGHVIQAKIAEKGRFIKLDTTLSQQAIALRGASVNAKQFLDFIQQKTAQMVLFDYGFLVPPITANAPEPSSAKKVDLDFIQQGFQGIEWYTDIKDFSDYQFESMGQTKGGVREQYKRITDEKLVLYNVTFEELYYDFRYSHTFEGVTLKTKKHTKNEFQLLLENMIQQYGEPVVQSDDGYFEWSVAKLKITVLNNYDGSLYFSIFPSPN